MIESNDPISRRKTDSPLTSCETCHRFREVLMLAPRSSFDLMASGIVFWSGIHLLAVESLFRKFGGVYSTLAQIGQEWVWGLIFIA